MTLRVEFHKLAEAEMMTFPNISDSSMKRRFRA